MRSSTVRARQSPRAPSALLARCAAVAALAGCRQDMHDAPRYEPLEASDVLRRTAARRGRSSTARSRAATCDDDALLYTGKVNGQPADDVPVPDRARGPRPRRRSASTSTARRATAGPATATAWSCSAASARPPSYHIDRLRKAPVGYFFDVMTNGFGAMPDYRGADSGRRTAGASSPTSARCS